MCHQMRLVYLRLKDWEVWGLSVSFLSHQLGWQVRFAILHLVEGMEREIFLHIVMNARGLCAEASLRTAGQPPVLCELDHSRFSANTLPLLLTPRTALDFGFYYHLKLPNFHNSNFISLTHKEANIRWEIIWFMELSFK